MKKKPLTILWLRTLIAALLPQGGKRLKSMDGRSQHLGVGYFLEGRRPQFKQPQSGLLDDEPYLPSAEMARRGLGFPANSVNKATFVCH